MTSDFSKVYTINLQVGSQISNVEQDCFAIFYSFSLASWLSTDYKIRILTHNRDAPMPYYLVTGHPDRLDPGRFITLYVFVTSRDYQNLTITHCIQAQGPPCQMLNPVVVRFMKYEAGIIIQIVDVRGFFEDVFLEPDRERFVESTGARKRNQLEYRYIEPEDQRFLVDNTKQHFHIAFQGGGAKGVAYLGAFKALKDLFPETRIRSFIGASAGGLLAMAVSAGAAFQQIISLLRNMDELTNARVIKNLEDLTPQKIQRYNHIRNTIRKLLHDHGLMTTRMFDIIANDVLVDEVIEAIFQMICGDNQALKNMFTLGVETKVQQGRFWEKTKMERKNRLVNYYGLLEGHMLSGDVLAEMCAGVLAKFINQKFKQNRQFVCDILQIPNLTQQFLDQNSQQLALRVNMYQYYLLTDGIEFTVTSVDMHDRILRFFNHKTTPYLPVCKAVQMTASYPIAFQAITWKRQWGKYYIHYGITRKQVDLTGHHFTDGGVLSNTPIKFLYNQSVRPMYFSHMSCEKTSILGFGLFQEGADEDEEEMMASQQKKKDNLAKLIMKNAPIMRLIYEQMFHVPKPKWICVKDMSCLKDIPLVNFLMDLLLTYVESNDNFVEQCFRKQIFSFKQTTSLGSFLTKRHQIGKIKDDYRSLRDAVRKMHQQMQTFNFCFEDYIQYIKDECRKLDVPRPKMEDLAAIKDLIVMNLKFYGLFRIRQNRIRAHVMGGLSQIYEQALNSINQNFTMLLRRAQKINHNRVFRCDCVKDDVRIMLLLLKTWENQFRLITVPPQQVELRRALQSHFMNFFEYIKKNVSEIETILYEFKNYDLQVGQNKANRPIKTIHDNKLIESISKLANNFPFKSLNSYKQFVEVTNKVDLNVLRQKKQFDANKDSLYDYIQTQISQGASSNIHLVFQSRSIMIKYYMDAYRLVCEYIFTHQTKKTKHLIERIIRLIVKENQREDPYYKFGYQQLLQYIVLGSDLHKYVSKHYEDLGKQIDIGYIKYPISEKLQLKIKNMIQKRKLNMCKITSITCSSVQCYFAFLLTLGLDSDRILSQIEIVRNLVEIDYQKVERDFFSMDWAVPFKCKVRDFQDQIWSNRYDMFKDMERCAKYANIEINIDRIKSEFEKSKDVVLDGFHYVMEYVVACELSAENHPKKSFDQYMAQKMSLKYGQKDYKKINEKLAKDTKQTLQLIYGQFASLVRHLIFAYSSQQLTEYLVNQKDPNKRQAIWKGVIMSNFIQVNKVKRRIQQLLSQMNLPPDIKLKEYVQFCPVKIDLTIVAIDITSNILEFINAHTYPEMPVWAAIMTGAAHSALFKPIRTKPSWSMKIDSNKEVRHLKSFFMDEKWYLLPIFASGSLLVSLPIQHLTNRKIREMYFNNQQFTFLNFGTIASKQKTYIIQDIFYRRFMSFSTAAKFLLKASSFEFSFFQISHNKILNTHINSDDNLILQVYDKQFLTLPVKVNTLDFSKLKVQNFISQTMEQTYYYTTQKFCPRKVTYVSVIVQGELIKLKFISKERKNKNLVKKYKVYYKFEINQQYHEMKNYVIEVKNPAINYLFIKFMYISRKQIAHKPLDKYSIFMNQYRLDISALHLFNVYKGLYGFPYAITTNGAMSPLKQAKGILKPQYAGSQLPYVLFYRSIVDLSSQNTGLYCQLCCSKLSVKSSNINFMSDLLDDYCSKCNDSRSVKYVCSHEFNDCRGRYCVKCCKNQVVLKLRDKIFCNFGHEFGFLAQTEYLIKSEEIQYARCSFCHELTDSYFLDVDCDNTLCQSCSIDFVLN